MTAYEAVHCIEELRVAKVLTIPFHHCPDQNGEPVDIGPEWMVAMAAISGHLCQACTPLDLMEAVGLGSQMYNAGRVSNDEVDIALDWVLRTVGLEAEMVNLRLREIAESN